MFITIGQFEIDFGMVETDSFADFLLNPFFIGGLISIIVLFIGVKLLLKKIREGYAMPVAFDKVVLLVLLPKQAGDPKSGQKEEFNLQKIQEGIGVMESFLSSIAGLKAQRGLSLLWKGRSDHISFEIVAQNETIGFYVAVDKSQQTYLEQQIQAQFPTAYIEIVPDYNIFSPKSVTEGAFIKLDRQNFFPIRSYKSLTSDPLNSLTNILSKVKANDGAVIQVVLRSARGEWREPGLKLASVIKQGKSPKDALREMNQSWISKFFEGFFDAFKGSLKTADDPTKPPSMDDKYVLSPLEEEMVKGLEEKGRLLGMDVVIRVVTSASNQPEAQMYLENILNSFNQYSLPEFGNKFKIIPAKKKDKFIKSFIYRTFDEAKSSVLNTEELASIFHFPMPSLETPKIRWLLSKKAPPPENIPKEGILLGRNHYRGKETEIRMKKADRQRHMYIIGTTGTGKTTLSENLITQDIMNGEGVCYIDPHGEAIEHILQIIPKERADDVILFDPSDIERPMALNLLEYQNEEQKTFVVNEMINIFDKLYDLSKTGGPRFEQYARNAMLLIMSDEASGSTLMEVPMVLSDANFRKYKLKKCKNMVVRDFWIKEAEKAGGEASLANMTTYITSKLTPFVANDILRPIISQQQSAFDFREAMDSKKIMLINLSKGKIGEMNMKLLGMIMVGKILVAALSRSGIEEGKLANFYLYIDEFQNCITDSIAIILSEARKYHLNLILAHQYIDQLVRDNDTRVRDAVFGNVGSMISYRIGVNDLEVMGKQFSPVFNEFDLLNCPAYNCYAKIMIDNANPPPFNMAVDYPLWRTNGDLKMAQAIKQLSRLKYGRDRKIVEAEIQDRIRKTELLASSM